MPKTLPGPKGHPVVGSSLRYARNPLKFITAIRQAYGDLATFELQGEQIVMLTNPTDIQRIFVTECEKFEKPAFHPRMHELLGEGLLLGNGDPWKQQRQLTQSSFQAERVRYATDEIANIVTESISDWSSDDIILIHREMTSITLKIIGKVMFGVDLSDATVRTIENQLAALGQKFEPTMMNWMGPDWLPTQSNREFQEAISVLDRLLKDIIREHSADNESDFLSLLLQARQNDKIDERMLRTELLTLLLAGHDTTSLALTYTWYLISNHSQVKNELEKELETVINGTTPSSDDLDQLKYCEQVLTEAMRLYPPVYSVLREPKYDVEFGNYRIPSDSKLMLSQWAVQRDSRWYDNPELFNPNRWTHDQSTDRPQFAYFPFGGGIRRCIGEELAIIESKMIIGTIAQQYRLETVSDQPLNFSPSLTLHPKNPIEMKVQPR
jgi:cytochrome P450